MNTNFLPQAADVRALLERHSHADLQLLAVNSGVPFTTLYKIRDGTTSNPGIETVRKFYELALLVIPLPEIDASLLPVKPEGGAA